MSQTASASATEDKKKKSAVKERVKVGPESGSATSKTAPSDAALTKRLFGEIKPDIRLFIIALILYAPILGARVSAPLVIKNIVDDGMNAKDLGAVTMWAGIFVGLVAMQACIEMFQLFIMQKMGQRAVRRLRNRLFAKIQRLPMSYFDRMPLGRVMTRVTNDVESLAELFSSGAVQIIGDILYLVGTLVILFVTDVKLSFAAVAVLPILAIGVQLFRVRAREAFRRVRSLLSGINASLQEHLTGMGVVQMFDQPRRVRAAFAEDNRGFMLANREAIALDAGVYAFVDAMSTVAIAIVLLVGAGLQNEGLLTLGVLVMFVDAMSRFFMPIRELSNKYTVIQSAFASSERIFELEDTEEAILEVENPKPATFEKELAFEDVRFAYGDGPDILRGLSFTVRKGERVAIVGHTGAGKSTIVKMVNRMYDVTDGAIRADGVDIREVDLSGLRQLSVAVPQDVFLFSGTLRENLTFGRPDVSEERLMAAIADCQAEPLLRRLIPDGAPLEEALSAVVKERGQNFSLGERQLLALVRALVCDPPILILDEATASVDRDTERRLQMATERLMQGRTALIVAHRLSTIESCDRILVLHQGVVVEEGSHAELLALDGRYAALVALQQQEGALEEPSA